MRKIIYILIIIVSVSLIVFLGWYFFLSSPQTIPTGNVANNSLPFGSGDDINASNNSSSGSLASSSGQEVSGSAPDLFGSPTNALFRISDTPVAGAMVMSKGSNDVVRYAERATGHIYDVVLPTDTNSNQLEKTRVTNTTLPKIYEAYFRSDGNAVLYRSLIEDSDIIGNTLLTLTAPKGSSTDNLYTVSTTPLYRNIGAVAVPSSGNSIYYILSDSSSIVSSSFTSTSTKNIVSSPFTEWRMSVTGAGLFLYTKASYNLPGYAYILSTTNGSMKKILGPLNGLVANMNSPGNKVMYSYVNNGVTKSFVRDLKSGEDVEVSPSTLAEKCVWSYKNTGAIFCGTPVNGIPGGEPDNWYRGASHFSDNIWMFDSSVDVAQILAEPHSNLGVDIDVTQPELSPDENYLIFTNKNDLTLWALRIE